MNLKIEKRGGNRSKPKKAHPWRKNSNPYARRNIDDRVWFDYVINVRYDGKVGFKH